MFVCFLSICGLHPLVLKAIFDFVLRSYPLCCSYVVHMMLRIEQGSLHPRKVSHLLYYLSSPKKKSWDRERLHWMKFKTAVISMTWTFIFHTTCFHIYFIKMCICTLILKNHLYSFTWKIWGKEYGSKGWNICLACAPLWVLSLALHALYLRHQWIRSWWPSVSQDLSLVHNRFGRSVLLSPGVFGSYKRILINK